MRLASQILLAFSIVLMLSLANVITNFLVSQKVKKNIDYLNKSQEIIRNSCHLHNIMIDMQSSFRGFLLTEDTSFLEGYNQGIIHIPELIIIQKNLVSDQPQQLALLDSINILNMEWQEYGSSLIDSRRLGTTSETANLLYRYLYENKLKKHIGKNINDKIALKFSEFDRQQYLLREQRSNRLINSLLMTHTISYIFFGLTMALGIASIIYIIKLLSKRIKTMVKQAERIAQGEFTIIRDVFKDELSSLTRSLNLMSYKLSKNINELELRNTELDKFAYVVSHDLKAPLRGIHHVIQWIEEDMPEVMNPKLKNYLEIISQRSERMENLINGLLEYARVRKKTIPEKTNVNELVHDIVETIVPRNFKVEITELPVLNTEKIKLEQIFTNLISNSVKYSEPDNGYIGINCQENEHHYEFSVRDKGIGIEPEYHHKIFEIFQTLRDENDKESTGIGLAIIKKILEDQNSTITLNSSPGIGSEFTFTWPKH